MTAEVSHLAQVTHLSEMLGIYVICSVWDHHLCTLPRKCIDDIAR